MENLTLVRRAVRRVKSSGVRDLSKRVNNKVVAQTRYALSKRNLATPKLRYAAIEINNTCNLHCPFCAIEQKRKAGMEQPRYIEPAFFKRIIDQLADMRVEEITLNYGGESLLHPNFAELLTYAAEARKRGLGKISWFDNATLFDENLSELAVKLGIEQVTFSVDRLGAANDKWRIGSNIQTIEKNITALARIRGGNKNPQIVINKIDVDTPVETYRFIKHWLNVADGVMVSTFRNPIFTVKDPDKYYAAAAWSKVEHCPFPFYFMGILSDGRITGCGCDASAENLMGDANTSSLKEIWRSTGYQRFRKDTLNHITHSGSPCKTCDCWMRQFKPAVSDIGDGLECVYGDCKTYQRSQKRGEKSR